MKDSKKMFGLLESVLAVLILILAFAMLREQDGEESGKVSVIIRDSDNSRWAAFKYGLRMAAQDQGVEMSVVSTDPALTAEDERNMIRQELENGADAVILQPAPGEGAEDMLKWLEKKGTAVLVEDTVPKDGEQPGLPAVKPDDLAMGSALAEKLLEDYNGNVEGKTMGIFSEAGTFCSSSEREAGFCAAMETCGAEVVWSVAEAAGESGQELLEELPKVDFVIALDDSSLTLAGKAAAANNLHGALVYGIGHSTEAVYYLDTGFVRCLVVPDEFNEGYQSLTEAAEGMRHFFRKPQGRTISFTALRRENIFSKENQEILFTMSQ